MIILVQNFYCVGFCHLTGRVDPPQLVNLLSPPKNVNFKNSKTRTMVFHSSPNVLVLRFEISIPCWLGCRTYGPPPCCSSFQLVFSSLSEHGVFVHPSVHPKEQVVFPWAVVAIINSPDCRNNLICPSYWLMQVSSSSCGFYWSHMTRDKTYRNDLGLRETICRLQSKLTDMQMQSPEWGTMIFLEDSSTLPHDEFLLIQRHVNLDWKVLIRIERTNDLTKYVANKPNRSLQYFLCQPSFTAQHWCEILPRCSTWKSPLNLISNSLIMFVET
jgi:hypothetical protein